MIITKRTAFRWIKVILLLYCIIGIALYYGQDYLFFHPEAVPASQKYNFATAYSEINIPYDSSSNLNIIQFHPSGDKRGVILYFHGNKKNISWYAKFVPNLIKHG